MEAKTALHVHMPASRTRPPPNATGLANATELPGNQPDPRYCNLFLSATGEMNAPGLCGHRGQQPRETHVQWESVLNN